MSEGRSEIQPPRQHVTKDGIPKKGWTRKGAVAVAKMMQDEGKHVEVYLCSECGEYHVGRQRKHPQWRSLRKDGARRAEVRAICAGPLVDYTFASWGEWFTLQMVAEEAAEIGRNERDQ